MTLEELDKLAAEKILGWSYESFLPVADMREDRSKPCELWYPPNSKISASLPSPTRNISQAFECLEKLTEDRWLFTIYDGAQHKSCVVYKYSKSFHAYGDTASEAIVRACLRARGIEV